MEPFRIGNERCSITSVIHNSYFILHQISVGKFINISTYYDGTRRSAQLGGIMIRIISPGAFRFCYGVRKSIIRKTKGTVILRGWHSSR